MLFFAIFYIIFYFTRINIIIDKIILQHDNMRKYLNSVCIYEIYITSFCIHHSRIILKLQYQMKANATSLKD